MLQAWRRLWQRVRHGPIPPVSPPPRAAEAPPGPPHYADKAPLAGRDYETKDRARVGRSNVILPTSRKPVPDLFRTKER
jgi:hypothetical protein